MTLRLSGQQRQHGKSANAPRLDRSPRVSVMEPVNPLTAKERYSTMNENTSKRVSETFNVQGDEDTTQ